MIKNNNFVVNHKLYKRTAFQNIINWKKSTSFFKNLFADLKSAENFSLKNRYY